MKKIIHMNIRRRGLTIVSVFLVVMSMGVLLPSASETRSEWSIETVDYIGFVGKYTSLALDSSGYPHISYYDDTMGDLKYAYQDAGGWHISTVDSTGSVGGYTSIALDNDYPRISYYDGSNGDLKYAWIEQPTVDYVSITLADGTEINNQALAPKFSLECYAAAFNATYGHLGFIDCSWNRVNSGGSNASLNATTGSRVKLYTGWYDGTVTLSIDDGSGHSDSVVFTIDQSAFSMVINRGWNLIGWLQGYATDAETLGQYIPGCTVVCKFDSNSQSYSTHVVGIPYNEFIITGGMGVFIYTTEASIWDGTDGTI